MRTGERRDCFVPVATNYFDHAIKYKKSLSEKFRKALKYFKFSANRQIGA